jgi:hypothetical protein
VLGSVANPDPGSGVFLPLESDLGWEKIWIWAGSRMEKFRSGLREKHPGSAALVTSIDITV